jgi:hypothetical protein
MNIATEKILGIRYSLSDNRDHGVIICYAFINVSGEDISGGISMMPKQLRGCLFGCQEIFLSTEDLRPKLEAILKQNVGTN